MASDNVKVAVIGLGSMGAAVAGRLLEQRHEVRVWNRSADKAVVLEQSGAVRAGSPAEAAQGADFVIVTVSDPTALRAVTAGPEGILAASEPATLVQMSTVAPDDIRALGARLADGWQVLDAPMFGSIAEAQAGKLTIWAGGPSEVFDRTASLLHCLGQWRMVGPLGTASATKLVANAALLGVVTLLGESFALANSLGLSQAQTFELLAATPLAAQAERRRPSIERNSYPPRFSLELALKDADLILAATEGDKPRLPLIEAVALWLVDADEAGWGKFDYTAILGHVTGVKPHEAA